MVGWRKAGDELTGAIGCDLVVIVTMRTKVSMSRIENIDREEEYLPFKVFPRARAVLGNTVNFFDG